MKLPFLIGKTIYLRGLQEEDAQGNYVQWLNDSEVCRFNAHHVFPYSREDGVEYIRNTTRAREALVLAIVLKKKDQHIGNIALQNIHAVNRSAEFAILLGEKGHWGKGHSREAALLLLKHGFQEMNLMRIYCGTSVENTAMQRLALSLGMVKEGKRRKAMFKHGQYHDILEYGILREEFMKQNKE